MNTQLNNIQIVLVETRAAGNIGATARAMKNMGVSRLWLVNPQCQLTDEAYWLATNAREILNQAQQASTLLDALAATGYVFGTTARKRRMRTVTSPREMASRALALAAHRPVAIVFGSEDKGLSNQQLELCNEVISIPTAPNGTSINLSHAVMIICYELHSALYQESVPELLPRAAIAEVEHMYDHMRSALQEIGFLNRQNPEHTIGGIRRILSRAGLSPTDVKLIRGLFRQLLWYMKNTK